MSNETSDRPRSIILTAALVVIFIPIAIFFAHRNPAVVSSFFGIAGIALFVLSCLCGLLAIKVSNDGGGNGIRWIQIILWILAVISIAGYSTFLNDLVH